VRNKSCSTLFHFANSGFDFNCPCCVNFRSGWIQTVKQLLGDLSDAIRRARESGARAAVLTGSGSIFSAGVDLFRVMAGAEPYASQFIPALTATFLELFEYPLPLVAAVNGHAIAGGCILACSCDYRLMAEGKGTIGVPELLVGVEFPTVALEIMRHSVPANELHALIYTGQLCVAGQAHDRGLIDEVVPLKDGAAAQQRLAEGKQFGKIVLTP